MTSIPRSFILNKFYANIINAYLTNHYSAPVGRTTEAVARRCSVKKMFLEISQNSQENICASACSFIKNTFSYRTPLMAASEHSKWTLVLNHIWTSHLFWLRTSLFSYVHLLESKMTLKPVEIPSFICLEFILFFQNCKHKKVWRWGVKSTYHTPISKK